MFLYQLAKDPSKVEQAQAAPGKEAPKADNGPGLSLGAAVAMLLLLAAAAPFLDLANGFGGLITLFIIFIGLQQAWTLTGRTEILITGPYEVEPAQ